MLNKLKSWLGGEVGRLEFYVVITILVGFLAHPLWELNMAITILEKIIEKIR